MQISWKDFLKRKLYKKSAYDAIGLAYTADQVLLCALKMSDEGPRWCLDMSFSHTNWQYKLHEYIKQHKLQNTPCYFALTAHWYKILQIERPSVDEHELYSALKWPLQEVAGISQEITYDYVDLPVQVAGNNKVLAVALPKKEIEKVSEAIFNAELNLQKITVEEFATLNLIPNSHEAVITLIQEHGEEVVVNIIKDGKLYFSRQIKGFENIGGFSKEELEMGVADTLGVQLQRTMDYFESQLRQAPVKKILIKLDTRHEQYVAEKIASAMGVECEVFHPLIKMDDGFNFKMASFSCLGAAMSHFNDVKAKAKEKADEVTN